MKKAMSCAAIVLINIAGCAQSSPPTCNDAGVLSLTEQLVKENAGAVFDTYVPANDPVQLLKLMGLGIGMTDSGNFYIPKAQAEKVSWAFSNTRTTSLDDKARTRQCTADVSYGDGKEVVGTFSLSYTISFTDDGHLYVNL